MHKQHLTKPQKNKPSQDFEAPLAFRTHHKIFLHRSHTNALTSLLLSYFDPDAPLVIDGSHISRFSFVMNKNPRTIKRQLLALMWMGENKYFTITRERGAFIVTFSKKNPLLNYTPLDYTSLSKDYSLTSIQINVYAIVQQRELLGLRPLPQREIARRIGCDKQSVVNAFKALRHNKLLQYKYILADYYHPLAKKWRTVYALTKEALDRIRTLRFFALQKAKRTLKAGKNSSSFNETSAKESHFLVWFNKFKQKYPDSDDCSLARTLNAILKKKKSLPSEEAIALAWDIFCQNKTLKLAAKVGWREAFKASLIERQGVLNDKSRYWKKLSQKRVNFYWFLSHVQEIKEGVYDERPLSDRAKGRAFEEKNTRPARESVSRRTEVPTECFNEYLYGSTSHKDSRALLMRLWSKYGWSTYETLIDPCEVVKNDAGRWVLMPPNRFHAKLLEEKLTLKWWRVVLPNTNKPTRSKLREAHDAWLKENPKSQEPREEKEEGDTGDITEKSHANTREKGGQEMGIVPANDDEGVIPAYVDDDAPHQSGQMPAHMGGRAKGQNLEAHGRESEEALLRMKKQRKESLIRHLSSCTNIHEAERELRLDTIKRYGINAYNGWFNRCRVEVAEGKAMYAAPNDFIAVEIERRYGVQVNTQVK